MFLIPSSLAGRGTGGEGNTVELGDKVIHRHSSFFNELHELTAILSR
jgi:hypothetical protein